LANWVKTEVRREIKERRLKLEQAIAPGRLAEVVILVDSGSLSSSAGKKVLAALWESDEEALAAAERLGLLQVRDSAEVEEWVRAAIAANPAQAELYRGGKTQLLGYFVGQVMRLSGGRAEPALVRQVLEAVLADSSEAVSSEA
jgi:aspartyl-tRNA(Asn)/glutamyl-tRNA(Gln) amidotransferase subunit B